MSQFFCVLRASAVSFFVFLAMLQRPPGDGRRCACPSLLDGSACEFVMRISGPPSNYWAGAPLV